MLVESPRIPVEGAWTRRSVTVSGGEPFETQFVYWLQAGSCYADLRVPFHPAAETQCFAGRSGWDRDGYCWAHQLDLGVPDAPSVRDVGRLTWERGGLVERGRFPTVGGVVGYEELWAPLPGRGCPAVAWKGSRACLVRVGDHAITVVDERSEGGAFRACYRHLGPDGWQVGAHIGDPATLPDPEARPDGWRIEESSPVLT